MAKKDTEYEYNPIKMQKDGTEAERVQWSTKSLEIAVDAIKKGLPLKANPFIGKDTGLLKPDLVYRRTEAEIVDYIKCKQDPIYFASKCFLMTPTGLQKVVLRDYQEDYLRHLQKNRFSIWLACRQAGKSTTTAIYCLWVILFNTDKSGLILSKSGPAGQDLVSKIKDMYRYLPYHLKCGTMKWNQSSISFDNNSSISTEAFSPTAGLGKTINFLVLDEFAWCPPNEVELFYNNIIPTVTTISDSNVCIMSTQNGFNLFHRLWKDSVEKKSMYAPFKVDWYQVPQYNTETGKWEKRTEAWKKMMIGILGSEEAFYYQYGTQFSASDNCLVSRECVSRLHDSEVLFTNNPDAEFPFINNEHLFWKPGFNVADELVVSWFIVTIDLAEGGGNDATVFNIFKVIDKDRFEQVGYWKANNVNLEDAALEFWCMWCAGFNNERTLISIEWNTYGALFYNYIMNLNEPECRPEWSVRFNLNSDGIDMTNIIYYKKGSQEDNVPGVAKTAKSMPGIKFSAGNKHVACALLRMEIERENIILTDIVTINELENFEDKNGNGSYAAVNGHDDIIMTFCQIPMLKETTKYKDWIEDYISAQASTSKPGYMNTFDYGGFVSPTNIPGFNSYENEMIENEYMSSIQSMRGM